MNAAEQLKDGQPLAALASLTEAVRAQPADARLRVFLAQLLCVLGQWERALNQLTVAAELDALAVPMKQVYGDAVRAEALRRAVFAGERTPLVLGEPPEWLAALIEAQQRSARDATDTSAAPLRQQAFDAAPAVLGRIDGQPFAWLADADMRFGPVLEALIHGRYHWVPFARLTRIELEAPTDLRDCVWLPAHLHLTNGGHSLALIPVRYPGSEAADDGALQLARRTDWHEPQPGLWTGLGQRVLATDAGEHALLDVREICFDPPPQDGAALATAPSDGAP